MFFLGPRFYFGTRFYFGRFFPILGYFFFLRGPNCILGYFNPLFLNGGINYARAGYICNQASHGVNMSCIKKPLEEYRNKKALMDRKRRFSLLKKEVIERICEKKPDTLEKLAAIKGVTKDHVTKYGADILEIVKNSLSAPVVEPKPDVKIVHTTKKAKTKKVKKKSLTSTPSPTPPVAAKSPPATAKVTPAVTKSPPAAAKVTPAAAKPQPAPTRVPPAPLSGVYILKLAHGKIYVGDSNNITRRTGEHMSHIKGAAWTKIYEPTGERLPRLGNVQGDGDAAERDETLKYMYKYGIENVRGWRYVMPQMDIMERADAEVNIRENMNLCRRCGKPGHFIKFCKEVTDRLGRLI